MSDRDSADAYEDIRADLVRELVEGTIAFHQLPDHLSAAEKAEIRRLALERMREVGLTSTGSFSFDPEQAAQGNCENLIGGTQIPTGIVGPLRIRGQHVDGEVYVPMATTEGALVASTNRGCAAIRAAGGVLVRVEDVGMTRAPVFSTSGIEETQRFISWIAKHRGDLEEIAKNVSRYLKLADVRPFAMGSTVFLRFRFLCGDAMGMNMATIACDRMVRHFIEPETGVECVALSGNYCVDKKPSSINFHEGRGKRIHAEIVIPGSVLERCLKTNAKSLVEAQYRKNLLGSIAAGARGYNAHIANILAAVFIATGQDLAHVVEGSMGVTSIEPRGDDGVYASIDLPDVPLGAVGGGTGLSTQREALSLIGAVPDRERPGWAAMRLAEIVGATALAGELSLMAAFTSKDLGRAHERLRPHTPVLLVSSSGRSRPPKGREAVVSAPGKLILMGEHAAVYGHPAMIAAIDMRLKVTITPRPRGEVSLDLPQLRYRGDTDWKSISEYTRACREEWRRCFADDRSERSRDYQLPGRDPDRLVRIALGECADFLEDLPRLGMNVRIDSELPVGAGLGSSAAVAVGVAAAYFSFLDLDLDRETLGRLCLEVERRQHGMPSGVDHTAVMDGGLLWAQRNAGGELVCEPIAARSPVLDRLKVFHSGIPAESTGVLVASVRRRIQKARERFRTLLDMIGELTRDLRSVLALEIEEPTQIVQLIRQCEAFLEELGVVPKPIRRIIRKVEDTGGAAKISGAGALTGNAGGSVILYHPEPDRISEWDFLRDWSFLPVRLGAEGLITQVGE